MIDRKTERGVATRMKKLFSYALLMGLASSLGMGPAARAETCKTNFTNAEELELGYLNTLVRGLQDRGLTELTSIYLAKQIKLIALPAKITSNPLVRVRLPNFRRERPVLEVAHLKTESELERQRAEWEVIKALFKVELNARFRERPPRSTSPTLVARPRQVGQYQAGRVTDLLADFYAATEHLSMLNPILLLPPYDPGRPWFPSAAIVTGPPHQLAGNQHDLVEYYKSGGTPVLRSAISERYERALMFAYWRIYVQRLAGTAVVAGATAAGLSVAVPAGEPPSAPTPEVSASQFGAGEAPRDSELTEADREIVRAKLKRLEEQLEKVRNSSMFDPPISQIEEIKQQILDLKNRYPVLKLPKESSH